MNEDKKLEELQKIAEEIKSFKGLDIAIRCKNPVPGGGNPNAEVMLIGEAPGEMEDKAGEPFVGKSGKYLIQTLKNYTGLEREQVFITNIVKFRPPENRDPNEEEITICQSWLDRQIQIIKPKVIVTLGRFSMAKFFPKETISRIHGQPKIVEMELADETVKFTVFPMFHPAAALRSAQVDQMFKKDFFKLGEILRGKTISQTQAGKGENFQQLQLF